ncbi:hypothetical protein ACIQOV_15235 [Kitasatospora sp. NPDC091257]|uniref:hypothetical protein n=1 Tax=unclassified Kitasatospora TaxID=2633591 RepID=UPI002F910F21
MRRTTRTLITATAVAAGLGVTITVLVAAATRPGDDEALALASRMGGNTYHVCNIGITDEGLEADVIGDQPRARRELQNATGRHVTLHTCHLDPGVEQGNRVHPDADRYARTTQGGGFTVYMVDQMPDHRVRAGVIGDQARAQQEFDGAFPGQIVVHNTHQRLNLPDPPASESFGDFVRQLAREHQQTAPAPSVIVDEEHQAVSVTWSGALPPDVLQVLRRAPQNVTVFVNGVAVNKAL